MFLIDEAHNLAGRVREMYSAELSKTSFYRLGKALKDKTPHAKGLRRAVNNINAHLLSVRKKMENDNSNNDSRVTDEPDKVFTELVERFSMSAGEWLKAESANAHPIQNEVLTLYFEVFNYLGIAEQFDEHYCAITEVSGSDVRVTLFCLDPSEIIAEHLKRAKASVLFSATLTPLSYHRDILGGHGARVTITPMSFRA